MVLISCLSLYGQDSSRFTFKGYLKYLHEADFVNDPDTLLTNQLIHNRLNFRFNFTSAIYARADLRTRLFYGQVVSNTPGFADYLKNPNSLTDPGLVLYESQSVVLYSELDRLFACYNKERWDIRIGRQRINWGTNLVWNPNDIFNTYNYFDFDYEERMGSDALRIQYSTGNESVIEFAASPGSEPDKSVYAGMYRTNLKGYDLQAFAGSFRKEAVAGTGWAGNLGEAGFKGEFTWFAGNNNQPSQVNFSTTVDYTPSTDWYVAGSFLYEKEPIPVSENALILITPNILSSKYLMPFRYSFFGSVIRQFSPVVNGQLAVIYGTEDRSMIFYPSFTWVAAENAEVLLTAQSFFSERNGTWKSSVTSAFFRFKWSF